MNFRKIQNFHSNNIEIFFSYEMNYSEKYEFSKVELDLNIHYNKILNGHR